MYGKPETGQKYSITHRGYQNNGEIIFALSRRLMNFIENVRSSSAMLRQTNELDIIIAVS